MKNFKIFIACPISKYLTYEGMNEEFEKFIKEVYETCKKYTNNTFLALDREKYGKARMEDGICTPLDFEEMKDSDIVIAFPEDSMGVAVELGWASAMKKKVLLILNKQYKASPLIHALYTVTDANNMTVDSENGYYSEKDFIVEQIKVYLDNILSQEA